MSSTGKDELDGIFSELGLDSTNDYSTSGTDSYGSTPDHLQSMAFNSLSGPVDFASMAAQYQQQQQQQMGGMSNGMSAMGPQGSNADMYQSTRFDSLSGPSYMTQLNQAVAQAQQQQMGGPQLGGPQMGGPQMGGPQMGGPQMGGPQMGGPQMGGPQMGGPQMGGPQMGGPQMGQMGQMGGMMMAPNMNMPGVMVVTCAHCNQPISGRCITALNKKWHPEHFVCAACYKPFAGGQFFEHQGKPYCEKDYHDLFGPRCAGCQQPITGRCVTALNKKWHPDHFCCGMCSKSLAGSAFVEKGGKPYCKECSTKLRSGSSVSGTDSANGELCGRCKKPIAGDYIMHQGNKCHPEHFTCAECHIAFKSGVKAFEYEGKLYCERDYNTLMSTCCAGCRKPIAGRCVTALGKQWHPEHFVCHHCEKPFAGGSFYEKDGKPYCEQHYHQLFGTCCAKCGKPITGRGVTALDKQWHPEHFTCVGCDRPLAGGTFCEWDGKPMCRKCFLKLPADLRKKLSGKKKDEKKKK